MEEFYWSDYLLVRVFLNPVLLAHMGGRLLGSLTHLHSLTAIVGVGRRNRQQSPCARSSLEIERVQALPYSRWLERRRRPRVGFLPCSMHYHSSGGGNGWSDYVRWE